MIDTLKVVRGWLLAPVLSLLTTEANRKARGMTAVEIAAPLVAAVRDWSEPVQIRFVPVGDAWVMQLRTLRQAHEADVAARAARQ